MPRKKFFNGSRTNSSKQQNAKFRLHQKAMRAATFFASNLIHNEYKNQAHLFTTTKLTSVQLMVVCYFSSFLFICRPSSALLKKCEKCWDDTHCCTGLHLLNMRPLHARGHPAPFHLDPIACMCVVCGACVSTLSLRRSASDRDSHIASITLCAPTNDQKTMHA